APTYLRIIFIGIRYTIQYNILANALRAIGDSRTPVFFLGISCGLNICLDLLLVCTLEWGVAGAGIATTLAEAVSVALCALWIYRRVPALKLARNELEMDKSLLGDTLRIGGMSALQQTAQPVGKVLIQSVVNAQGIIAVDAFNTVCRVDDFACIPAQSIGSGIMTCTAQNRGAGRKNRVYRSIRDGLLVGLCYFPVICILTLLLKAPVAHLMAPAPTPASQITAETAAGEIITADDVECIVQESILYLSVKAFFFIMPCILNAMQGFFRGMGRMGTVFAGTVIQISIRTFCVYMWVPRMGITGEAWGCLTGWMVQLIFTGTCLLIARSRYLRENRLPRGV
ncbi:MAG: MATE family efflux transporter, partial [Clostridiales bacterium]|nr:MATE family efflux transporter [Clostridiales bacterium]